MFDVLKYHLVTTLPKSINRRNYIQHQFQKLSNNPNFKVNFYYGLDSTRIKIDKYNNFSGPTSYYTNYPGFIGCVSALLGCVNYAKIMNWPYLFVFEDDMYLDANFYDKINEYVKETLDYKMILLGYMKKGMLKEFNNYLYKPTLGMVYGGYGYLINSKYYDWVINEINNLSTIKCRDHIYFVKPWRFQDKIFCLRKKLVNLSKLNNKSTIMI